MSQNCNITEKLNSLLKQDDVISSCGFNFPCRLRVRKNAKYLSVNLHGSVKRNVHELPVFARWNWGQIFGAHILSICDPTLYYKDDLNIGWYLGSKDNNATEGVAEIALKCAEMLGIPEDRVIFFGSSGGGFTAIQASLFSNSGKAIAINAQTNLARHFRFLVEQYLNAVGSGLDFENAAQHYAERWDLISGLLSAKKSGKDIKIVNVQNINDSFHYNNHFMPFADAFGLSKTDQISVNNGIFNLIYSGTFKHEREPMEVIKIITANGLSYLLDGVTDTDIQPYPLVIQTEFENNILSASCFVEEGNLEGDVEYEFYVSINGKLKYRQKYSPESNCRFEMEDVGNSRIRLAVFAREKHNHEKCLNMTSIVQN